MLSKIEIDALIRDNDYLNRTSADLRQQLAAAKSLVSQLLDEVAFLKGELTFDEEPQA